MDDKTHWEAASVQERNPSPHSARLLVTGAGLPGTPHLSRVLSEWLWKRGRNVPQRDAGKNKTICSLHFSNRLMNFHQIKFQHQQLGWPHRS
ncbi:Omega-Amidase Nit2 [Manis pentadactyla]|nr:Omega-Amidase Nit2 [Manis pentadactyla]